jgi:hypothetical protein
MSDRGFVPSRASLFPLVAIVTLLASSASVYSESSDDFDSADVLQSGAITEGKIMDEVYYFKIEVETGDAIEFVFQGTDMSVRFCIYEGNHSSDQVLCRTSDSDQFIYYQKATKEAYYVKVDCGECEHAGSEGDYFIKVIIHLDEAGDTLGEQVLLMPDVMIHGSLFGTDADFFNIPVMCGDGIIRFVITDENTGGMTSYRLYDSYGIKIKEGYETPSYDFTSPVGSRTEACSTPKPFEGHANYSVELICAFEGHCDYSLIAIGSTWEPLKSSFSDEKGNPADIYLVVVVIIGLLMSLKIFGRNRAKLGAASYEKPNEGLGESILPTKINPPPATDESSISKSREIQSSVQIQDSVHQGDIVGGDKISTKVVNEPEAIARAAIEAYEMGKEKGSND